MVRKETMAERKFLKMRKDIHPEYRPVVFVLDWVKVETKTSNLKPVEYKHGKSNPGLMDEIQLCA